MCSNMLADRHNKFWTMWSRRGWYARHASSEAACWGSSVEAASHFWQETSSLGRCGRNWGSQLAAPSVFGFAESMQQFCAEHGRRLDEIGEGDEVGQMGEAGQSGQMGGVDGIKDGMRVSSAILGNDSTSVSSSVSAQQQSQSVSARRGLQEELVAACRSANLNLLRIGEWNMCKNVQWMFCALSGSLAPGSRGSLDGGGEIVFSLAPKELDVEPFYKGSFYRCCGALQSLARH